jgi:hypothetical protein
MKDPPAVPEIRASDDFRFSVGWQKMPEIHEFGAIKIL